jgi:hypothetical protein
VASLGLVGAQALKKVDQDLRILYTEYTLAATDLAHIMADMMRFRTTIIRALEAKTQPDFERSIASLPDQRAHIYQAVDRYAAASTRTGRSSPAEQAALQAVRDSLDAYFAAARQTAGLLTQAWAAGSPREAAELQHRAEVHAADNAGPKLILVSTALEQLLKAVAEVARTMRDEGAHTVRTISLLLIVGSLVLAGLNLFVEWLPAVPHKDLPQPAPHSEPTSLGSPSSRTIFEPAEED